MAIDKKIIDELLKDYQSPDDLIGEKGLLKHRITSYNVCYTKLLRIATVS